MVSEHDTRHDLAAELVAVSEELARYGLKATAREAFDLASEIYHGNADIDLGWIRLGTFENRIGDIHECI